MGGQDTPDQRSLDQLLAEAEYAERQAVLQHKLGDMVTFVTYPELIGRDGIIVHVNAWREAPYTVELTGGGSVYCRDDDLAPVP